MVYRSKHLLLVAGAVFSSCFHTIQCQAFQSPLQLVPPSNHWTDFIPSYHSQSAARRKACSRTQLYFLNINSPDEENRLRPDIFEIQRQDEFLSFLDQDDRICIVKFYASWCKSCQKFGQKYRKLAHELGDQVYFDGTLAHRGKVRFAEAEYSENAKLCKSLKVRKLPTVHIYRKGKGKLVDMTCRPSQFENVIDELNRLLDASGEDISEECKGGNAGVVALPPFYADEFEKPHHADETRDKADDLLFDKTMEDGSNFAEGLLKEVHRKMGKDKVSNGTEEKTQWFPFSF